MRVAAFEFVLAHWQFFVSFIALGVAGAVLITFMKRLASARDAKEEAARSKLLDQELAEIRRGLGEPPSA